MGKRLLIVFVATLLISVAAAFVVRLMPQANLEAPFIVVVVAVFMFIGPLSLTVTYLLTDRARTANRGDVSFGDPALAKTGRKVIAEGRFMTRLMDERGRSQLRHVLFVALQARDISGEVSKTWTHKVYGSGPMPETAVRVPLYFDPEDPARYYIAWAEVEPAEQSPQELRAIAHHVDGINLERFPRDIETAYLRAAVKARQG